MTILQFKDTMLVAGEDGRLCRCGNCDWQGRAHETDDIKDFEDRVYPGEACPVGECPECGALAHWLAAPEVLAR